MTLRASSLCGALLFTGAIAVLAAPTGCDNGATAGAGGEPVTNSAGSTYHPACQGGVQDGVCITYGDNPETCDCLDCTDTAFCKSGCKDDGKCSPSDGEDCTCKDCWGQQIPVSGDDPIQCPPGETTDDGPGPGPTTAASSGSSGGAGTTATTAASTTVATAASTSADTTAATSAASTAAATDASSSTN